jgi:hypothetical protein
MPIGTAFRAVALPAVMSGRRTHAVMRFCPKWTLRLAKTLGPAENLTAPVIAQLDRRTA